ncbi:hypothetical protein [Tepidiforma sp.]|uniref:hypothetical protein n=1 Tax=Tepidiforma sp. TaxID=2682230 RepID=UPI002ADE7183|nr:hypothetical protein [Tepidiforma sp.]
MGALAELGLTTGDGPIMLIAPPDGALAEAGRMKPRPAVASTLLTAEPTPRILWWPEPAELRPGLLSRLRWLLESASGEAWLILDAHEPAAASLPDGLRSARFDLLETRPIGRGETALRIRPAGA